jgi:hypothetical protein
MARRAALKFGILVRRSETSSRRPNIFVSQSRHASSLAELMAAADGRLIESRRGGESRVEAAGEGVAALAPIGIRLCVGVGVLQIGNGPLKPREVDVT